MTDPHQDARAERDAKMAALVRKAEAEIESVFVLKLDARVAALKQELAEAREEIVRLKHTLARATARRS